VTCTPPRVSVHEKVVLVNETVRGTFFKITLVFAWIGFTGAGPWEIAMSQMGADGVVGSNVVADPHGDVNGSGIGPTAKDLAPTIPESSHTVLGLVSLYRSVYVHMDAPDNLNLHAAIYAGNSAAYDEETGRGCGSDDDDRRGCGFGYEGWDFETGKGTLKLLGSISEYRSQTIGRLNVDPTGYSRRLAYDERFLKDIMPPGFPISSKLQAFPIFHRFRAWQPAKLYD